nr:purine-nucleoside phosphorylase [FCB group bacterium]
MDQGQALSQKIEEAYAYLSGKVELPVRIGIILGTGLGRLAEEVEMETEVQYGDIPHFPVSTVESHAGRFIFGKLGGKRVVVMQGRFHYYEGYHMHEITFPVRVMKEMGVTHLLISNAAGGLNPLYKKCDIMLMDDHINLIGDNPLIGINDPKLGPRFPDMSEPYSKRLMDIGEKSARENGFSIHR